MAITDRGLPATDPHTAIKNLIESNMASPDGSWTPVVNDSWLDFKKQKTFQIALQPIIGETIEATLGTGTQMARTSVMHFQITLFAPTRAGVWAMMTKFIEVINNGTLSVPAAGISDGYHFIRIVRSDETKPVRMLEPNCGPGQGDENCIGYRTDYTAMLRWEE